MCTRLGRSKSERRVISEVLGPICIELQLITGLGQGYSTSGVLQCSFPFSKCSRIIARHQSRMVPAEAAPLYRADRIRFRCQRRSAVTVSAAHRFYLVVSSPRPLHSLCIYPDVPCKHNLIGWNLIPEPKNKINNLDVVKTTQSSVLPKKTVHDSELPRFCSICKEVDIRPD